MAMDEVGATLGIVPKFTFSEDEEDEFDYHLGLSLGGAADSVPQMDRAIAELKRFLQPECLCRFIEWSLRRGQYCLIETQADGGQVSARLSCLR